VVRERVSVDVDLAAVATHLSREDGRAVGVDDVRRWLRDAGFERHGDRWLVEERDLGQLDPSEVRSMTRVAVASASERVRVRVRGSLRSAHGTVARRRRRWLR
jgi:hypothetical protein